MKCKEIHNKLIFFLDKELPAFETEQIQKHLKKCSDCIQFVEDMKITLGILEEEKAFETNPYFYTRVKTRFDNQGEEAIQGRPVLARILQPTAFIIILIVGIYGGIKLGQPHNPNADNSSFSEQQMIPYLNEMDAEPIEAFLME